MDWDVCFLCQEEKDETPRTSDKDKRTYATLSKVLPQFAELGLFDLDHLGCNSNSVDDIMLKLDENNAVYHHSCTAKYNNQKLERAKKKQKTKRSSNDFGGESCKRSRTDRTSKIEMGESKCLFCLENDNNENLCAAGTLHAKLKIEKGKSNMIDKDHVREFTEKLKEKALKLDELAVVATLSHGDVVTNEIYYHKECLKRFNAKYDALILKENKQIDTSKIDENIRKEYHFRKVVEYVKESYKDKNESQFKVLYLENMYKELLQNDGIHHVRHTSRFTSKLLSSLPGTEVRILNSKSYIFLTSSIDDIIKDEITPHSFFNSLVKVVGPIRAEMSNITNKFMGSFSPECQKLATPIKLQMLCSILIDGYDNQSIGFSQSSLSVSQLIMYQYRKSCYSASNNRRHLKHRETPVPIYTGLKLYATVRSKNMIQKLFTLGICISYERIIEICNSIAASSLKQYERDKVFVPSTLKLDIFSIVAKDNIDLNASSTKIKQHYHGISMTVMQFPSFQNNGILQDILYDVENDCIKKSLELPDDYTNLKDLPFKLGSPLFYHPSTHDRLDYESVNDQDFIFGLKEEIDWLENVDSKSVDTYASWAKYHSRSETKQSEPVGIQALLPLINKKVATVKAQFHCMSLIIDTIKFLNPKQVAVDVSDQPVYALSKEVQIRYPSMFGPDKYVCLLGDLHIEQELLGMHGELIKGSGLEKIMAKCSLSTIGTSTLVDSYHIKRSRYILQVSVAAIYKLLKIAHSRSGSELSPLEWLDQSSQNSQMCFYWQMILNFQLLVLLHIRSIREGKFKLYLDTLYQGLKWYFALDKYNYARWATIYWFDLFCLQKTCPSVHEEFMKGKFSFLKNDKAFSRMALDQIHEQNNKNIKSVSGATALLNRQNDSALIRWELCGPELSRIILEFENSLDKSSYNEQKKKHHEDNKSFQIDFYNDVQTVFDNFPCNPFTLNELTAVNNTNVVFDDNIYHNISKLESSGSAQLQEFINSRLVLCKDSISKKISLNHFILPGHEKSTKPRGSIIDKRLSSSFYLKLRGAINYRRNHAKLLFQSEVFDTAQCFSVDDENLYHGTKSSILQRFDKTPSPEFSSSSAIIIELSPILRCDFHAHTFDDFAEKIYRHIMDLGQGYERIDVIADCYFEQSLKSQTRNDRGIGNVEVFAGESKFPSDFKANFLKNSENKNQLNLFLAEKLCELHKGEQILLVTKDRSIQTTNNFLFAESFISDCHPEEADQKLVRHMIHCTRTGFKNILVKTVDTDVILLLLSYRHYAGNFETNIVASFGMGKSACFYDINSIAKKFGEKTCQALPFFHTFTGCDNVSSFFNHGKCKFWDRWNEYQEKDVLTDVFIELSNKPVSILANHIETIEKYLIFVYYGSSVKPKDINLLRMIDFEHSTHNNLRLLPPSRVGLIEHIKRAAYEGGWVHYQCMENTNLPDPQEWGWKLKGYRFIPKWQIVTNVFDPLDLTVTCSCTKQKCTNCLCRKKHLECIQYCKCQRKCLYTSI